MPEEQYPVSSSLEPRPIYHIGPSIKKGCKQYSVVDGVVFKVSILNDDDISLGFGKTSSQCGTFPFVTFMVKNLNVFLALIFFQDILFSVCGVIINDDDFFHEVHSLDLGNQYMKRVTFVINGNNNREFSQVTP